MSAAQSQIRALETTVFDAQAKAHSLQKQVSALEDELLESRSASRARPFSPGVMSRPSSRGHTDLHRSSFNSHRPSNLAPPLSRSMFDQNLTPETRHKRRVSLSMLKARIESEVAVSSHHPPSSRALSPILSHPESDSLSSPTHSHSFPHAIHRPQFLDESHVFWCNSCHGDLVVL